MDASEFFDICAELITGEPSADATRRLHEVLKLCCAEGCRRQGGAFGNLFSQVDYLCKLLHLSHAQTRDLQDARRHTNANAPVGSADWPYDIKAVARLVSAVFSVDIPSSLVPLLPADERQHERGLGDDVEEKLPFTAFKYATGVLVFYVHGHMFSFFDCDNYSVITLKCQPERIEDLKAQYECIGNPYNESPKHWIGINPETAPDELLKELTRNSYEIVKAKYKKHG